MVTSLKKNNLKTSSSSESASWFI